MPRPPRLQCAQADPEPHTGVLQLSLDVLQLVSKQLEQNLRTGAHVPVKDATALKDIAAELHRLAGLSEPDSQFHSEQLPGIQTTLSKRSISDACIEMDQAEFDALDKWQQELVQCFSLVDHDSSGTVELPELLTVLRRAHVPKARVMKFLRLADKDGNGSINFAEWLGAIKEIDQKELRLLTVKLKESVENQSPNPSVLQCMMIHPLSVRSLAWSVLMIMLCFYIAIVQPFELAFENMMTEQHLAALATVGIVIDSFFVVDIAVNFLTGYASSGNEIIMDSRRVFYHYATSWFFFDLICVLPAVISLSTGEGSIGRLRWFKLIKLVRLSRLSKISQLAGHALDQFMHLEELIQMQWVRFLYRRGIVFIGMVLMCHWMACCMKLVDDGFLSSYQDVGSHPMRQYTAALYWSMTTLTTVGYGDITPASDGERIFCILSMVVGSSFYGYVIGSISALVAQQDLNLTSYFERMDLVYAWVNHYHLPKSLGLTVCRHFRHLMAERTAISENAFWHDLSPELQKEVGEFIVHEDVKYNHLFDGIPLSAVVRLQSILIKFTVFAGLRITETGDVGSAMYIIDFGSVLLTTDKDDKYQRTLEAGASFGEEVLFGFKECYEYTTVAFETSHIEMINEAEFKEIFHTMPHAWERMYHNARRLTAS
eukprot:TRINITY_DN36364_c0_g1_i1.p1 TRINITY_DN36364_c0_g1~~TRINITY_DN36364_c0_g1_i1.p1  ORF type:complete len:656 (+),score=91.14 TRINITY_DN36364_c0_g1_i1:60-2027(+)